MSEGRVRVSARELSPEAFERYGRVVRRPPHSPDATGPGWTWWAETLMLPSDGRAFGVGFLSLAPTEPAFDWAERHMLSVEAVVPLDGDCLVYVGPPDDAPSLERFRVFRVDAGEGVVLEKGVWHGAPLALDRPLRAVVLLLEGTGANDTTVVRFPDTPVTIERAG